MNNFDTLYIIESAVELCKKHNYFNASTVLVSRSNPVNIILIYSDAINRDLTFNTYGQFKLIVLNLFDCFQALLSRDIFFVKMCSDTLPIRDSMNLIPKLKLSLEPIRIYNNMKNISENTMYIRQSMAYDENDENMNDEFSLRFMQINNLESFIKNILIPISSSLKPYLSDTQYMIEAFKALEEDKSEYVLTFFIPQSKIKTALLALQTFLFENVSELKLEQIYIPYKRQIHYSEHISSNIKAHINSIICRMTEDIVVDINNGLLSSESNKVTLLIYIFLISSKYFFRDINEFINANEAIINKSIPMSISNMTKYMLDNNLITNIEDKIVREYSRQIKQIWPTLYANYYQHVKTWSTETLHDKTIEYLKLLQQIRIEIDSMVHTKSYPPNAPELFFENYYHRLFNCFDIPSYYRAFIPFCVKYLYDE